MCSKEKDLVEGHIEAKEARLCGEQKVNIEKNIRIEENSWGQQETPMQWMLIEEEREIGHASYVENGAIWPKIVGKEKEERGG